MTNFEKALEENAKKSSKESCDSKYEWQNYDGIFYAGARWAREFTIVEVCKFIKNIPDDTGWRYAQLLESHFKDRGGE